MAQLLSNFGIIIDQTYHILQILYRFFEPNVNVKLADNVLRTDRQFNEEIRNYIPDTTKEIKDLEIIHNGSYLSIYGSLFHIGTASRLDLCKGLNRL